MRIEPQTRILDADEYAACSQFVLDTASRDRSNHEEAAWRLLGHIAAQAQEIERLREANETIETYEQVCHESLPKCVGAWVSGSGGHRKHAGGCDRVATWWQEDDCYAYCDKHKEAHDRYKEVSWAGLVRLIAELERELETERLRDAGTLVRSTGESVGSGGTCDAAIDNARANAEGR